PKKRVVQFKNSHLQVKRNSVDFYTGGRTTIDGVLKKINSKGEGARMLRDVLIQKGLSNREAEVAELVTKGLSNKEVANQLFVTEKTVKFHLTNIYKKMNVKSRAQLIVWCLPHFGFVEKEEKPIADQSTN